MKLNTVNVIELFSGIFESIHSFTDDAEGNKEAENLFATILEGNEFSISAEELSDIIDEGHFECGKFELLLVHS
jgi:hypothetical protein